MDLKSSNELDLHFFKDYSKIRESLMNSFDEKISISQKVILSQQLVYSLFVLGFLVDKAVIKSIRSEKLTKDDFLGFLKKRDFNIKDLQQILIKCRMSPQDNLIKFNDKTIKIPYLNIEFFTKMFESKWMDFRIDYNSWCNVVDFVVDYSKNFDFINVFGTIFERDLALITSINSEEVTENGYAKILVKLNERRRRGVYYTPKEITNYISKNTLKSFLADKLGNKNDSILDDIDKMGKNELSQLMDIIEKLRILDPACGSGDFLIEMSNEIFNLRIEISKKLGQKINPYEIKRSILTGNIFGIDIQKSAVEITKLRLWLWLISEELPNFVPNNNQPLFPEMYFNIRNGNSLIGWLYEDLGIKESDYHIDDNLMYLHVRVKEAITYNLLPSERKDLFQDTDEFIGQLIIVGEKQRLYTKLDVLKTLNENLRKLVFTRDLAPNVRLSLYAIHMQLRHVQYQAVFDKFYDFIKQKNKQISLTSSDIELINPFHWNIDFNWILSEGGFSIIIGNPPYIENKKIRNKLEKQLQKIFYKSAYKLYDLAILFLERSLKLLGKNNYLSFIITNKFISTDYGIKIRKILLTQTKLKEIIDVSYLSIFSQASTYPIIITCKDASSVLESNQLDNQIMIAPRLNDLKLLENQSYKKIKIKQKNFFELPNHIFEISGNISILKKLEKNESIIKLSELGTFYYRPFGFINWIDSLDFVKRNVQSKNDLRFIGTTNVRSFAIDFRKQIKIAGNRFTSSYMHYNQKFKDIWEIFKQPKLLIKEIAKELTVAYDPGFYANSTGIYMLASNKINLKYLLLILNSKLLNFYFSSLFGSTHMAGGYLRFNGSYLKQLPIIQPKEPKQEKLIIKLSDYLLFLNQIKINSAKYGDINNIDEHLKLFGNLADYLVLEVYFMDKFSQSFYSELSDLITSINYDKWLELSFEKKKNDDRNKLEMKIKKEISDSYNSIKNSLIVKQITNEILSNKEFKRIMK